MKGFHGFVTLLVLLFIIGSSTAGRENPLFDLSTRMDLVNMAGYGEEKLSSVLVAGTVLCEACLDGEAEFRAWPISGAMVGVTCKYGGEMNKLSWARERTDENGDFIIDLPSHLHANPRLDKACFVKVLAVPKNSPCQRVFVGKSNGIRLSSVGNGIRTYTTGRIRFQLPYESSHLCLKKGDNEEEDSW